VYCGEEFGVRRPDALSSYRAGQGKEAGPKWTGTINLVNGNGNTRVFIRVARMMDRKPDDIPAFTKLRGVENVIHLAVLEMNAKWLEWLSPAQLNQFFPHCC
jgi:hypothetical protein